MRVLFIDFSTCLDSVNDLDSRARGGMISSLFRVPEYLAKYYEVAVWSDIKNSSLKNDVRWYSQDDFNQVISQQWDFVIFNRGIHNGLPELNARRRILWTHDLPHGGFAPNPKLLRAFSGVVFMSRYAEKVWRIHYNQIGKSFLIPNGVDFDLFYPREKDLDYLIYISAPNRGLNRLGLIYLGVKDKLGRDLKFKAYSNMSVLHPAEVGRNMVFDLDNPRENKHGARIPNEGEIDGVGTVYPDPVEMGIEVLDPIPQENLADELGKAGLMIMPTGYPEICSNAVLQSLASGTPIISGNIGSINEWVKNGWNGYLTKTQLNDYLVYLVEIARSAVDILKSPKLHKKLIRNASKTKGLFSWEQIGKRWCRMLARLS